MHMFDSQQRNKTRIYEDLKHWIIIARMVGGIDKTTYRIISYLSRNIL